MNTYTVVLLYPDYISDDYGGETYISTARGDHVGEAIAMVQQEVARTTSGIPAYDFRMIAVFRGDCEVVANVYTNYVTEIVK